MTTDPKIPRAAQQIAEHHPDVWAAYQQFGKAAAEAGPLEPRTIHLVKIAAAIANQSEGATHSHVRRALEAGVPAEDIRHVSILLAPTLGFPQAAAGRTWIEDILAQDT